MSWSNTKNYLTLLKEKARQGKGELGDEFPMVLLAYHMTKRKSTGETSFTLAYGEKFIIYPYRNQNVDYETIS